MLDGMFTTKRVKTLRSSTEYEIAALPAPHGCSLDSSCRRRPASRGGRGWIPAFAGMTEASCQFVGQIVPAQVFSKENAKITKFGRVIFEWI